MGYGLEEPYSTTGPIPGDVVDVPDLGPCEVLPSAHPGLVHLKTPGGSTLKIGEEALRDMVALSAVERLRREETGNA